MPTSESCPACGHWGRLVGGASGGEGGGGGRGGGGHCAAEHHRGKQASKGFFWPEKFKEVKSEPGSE